MTAAPLDTGEHLRSHPSALADSSVRTPHRVAAIDLARLFGLFLVYYGHVVEQVMYLGNQSAVQQYKFIYSFHMPLFFVLSGAVAKDWSSESGPGAFLKSRLASRVVPLLAFNLLLGLVSLVTKPRFPPIPLQTLHDYTAAAVNTLTRLPVFDIPTWFLMCLVSVEIIHFAVYRFLRASIFRISVAIVLFYAGGYALNLEWNFLQDGTNWWFWNEAITVYAFYLVGVLIARHGLLEIRLPSVVLAVAGLSAMVIVATTYDLNQGPFRLKIPAVVILAAAHGQIFWFAFTSLAGTAAVLFLSLYASSLRWLGNLSQNALALFCLNGVVYHHLNTTAAHWFIDVWPQSGWGLFIYAAGLTTISLAAAMPVTIALTRYVPQLVGRPTVVGPWMPAILGSKRSRIRPI